MDYKNLQVHHRTNTSQQHFYRSKKKKKNTLSILSLTLFSFNFKKEKVEYQTLHEKQANSNHFTKASIFSNL